ncbi:long-chain fatty acid--CoA ligase [Mycobacterium arosiense ATCC BAA-1401 = DSM 45069]|uniref:Long-chain fatty acid--CoA ligase n=1 Tax=Mycobacterium arosiense ATCC BAA-1401 = DSM 45069 TaxID=1265311 RepID=A0A1W9ZBP0_MYCAI|nr:long-chain fatty acid--CoA ligase [Mycobacterium arosiense ATCC BAA-1401 = DSM 45069]
MITAINTSLDIHLPVRALFEAPTVRSLGLQLDRYAGAEEVVAVETLKDGTGVPLWCIHDGLGLSWAYRALGNYLDCPIIGINQVPHNGEAEPPSIRSMAASYADRLEAIYPGGPYKLLGWSFGGVVAHELAIELRRRGYAVERLILLDPALITNSTITEIRTLNENQIVEYMLRTNHIDVHVQSGPESYRDTKQLTCERNSIDLDPLPKSLLGFIAQRVNANHLYLLEHMPDVFDGDMVIFSAARGGNGNGSPHIEKWGPYVDGNITAHSVDCAHHEMLTTRSLNTYGEELKLLLQSE